MNAATKTLVFWLVIVFAAILIWESVKAGKPRQQSAPPEISYSEFLNQVDAGNVAKVTISSTSLIGTDRQGKQFRVSLPPQHEELVSELRKKNVEIWYRNSESGSVATWIANFGPILLIAALWLFMVRIMRRRQSQSLPPGTPSPPADNRWRQP